MPRPCTRPPPCQAEAPAPGRRAAAVRSRARPEEVGAAQQPAAGGRARGRRPRGRKAGRGREARGPRAGAAPGSRPLRTARRDENLTKEGGKRTRPAFLGSISEIRRSLFLRSRDSVAKREEHVPCGGTVTRRPLQDRRGTHTSPFVVRSGSSKLFRTRVAVSNHRRNVVFLNAVVRQPPNRPPLAPRSPPLAVRCTRGLQRPPRADGRCSVAAPVGDPILTGQPAAGRGSLAMSDPGRSPTPSVTAICVLADTSPVPRTRNKD